MRDVTPRPEKLIEKRRRQLEAQREAGVKVARAKDAMPGTKPTESSSENEKLKLATMDKDQGSSIESKMVETPEVQQPESEFEITDWTGYPEGPKPQGPFRILEGKEYESARKLADQTNQALHRSDSSLDGLQIHEVKPVKFGGSPTEIGNKIALTPADHARYTTWWNRKYKEITSK